MWNLPSKDSSAKVAPFVTWSGKNYFSRLRLTGLDVSRTTDISKHFSSNDIQNSLENPPNQSDSKDQNAKIKLLRL